jgi:hypothetical protein
MIVFHAIYVHRGFCLNTEAIFSWLIHLYNYKHKQILHKANWWQPNYNLHVLAYWSKISFLIYNKLVFYISPLRDQFQRQLKYLFSHVKSARIWSFLRISYDCEDPYVYVKHIYLIQ